MSAVRGGPPKRTAAAFMAALALAAVVAPLVATPAAAIGTTVDVYVHPPRSVGTPSKDGPGAVDLTADANVFGSSTSAGTLVYTVTSNMGWEARPSTFTQQVPSGGGQFSFDFQIMVPPEANAGIASGIQVLAEYRVGPATLASGVGGASVEAGKFYDASLRRVTAPEPMSPGRTYVIEYEIVNDGNADSVMEFHWMDPGLNSRLKADFIAPATVPVAGHSNETAEFRITPQGTTPAGAYQIPAQMVVTDRTGDDFIVINFTIQMEFSNLPIYPGILPRFDLQGVSAILGWLGVFLTLWLLANAGIAFTRRRDFDEADGLPFLQAYRERLSSTLVYKGLRRAVRRGGRKRKRARPVEDA